jgi:5'-nucleotidase
MDAEIMRVVRDLPAGLVNVIVAGHAHLGVAHEVAGIAILESYSGGRAFGRVDVTINRSNGNVLARRIFPPRDIVRGVYEGSRVVPDTTVERVLAPAAERAWALKSAPLGVILDTPLTREPSKESALGNLFADLMRQAVPGSDVALTNNGGVRKNLPPGPLTYGRFFEAMPFDNRLVSLTLTGAQLGRIFENNFQQGGTSRIPVSGVRVTGRCESGALRVRIVRDSGAPVRDNEQLTVITNDFIALGGNDILTPLGNVGYTDLPGPGMRDAMVELLRKHGGRLKASDLLNPQQARIVYPPTLPAQCAL